MAVMDLRPRCDAFFSILCHLILTLSIGIQRISFGMSSNMSLPALLGIETPPSSIPHHQRYGRLETWSKFNGFRGPTAEDLKGLEMMTGFDERELSCFLCNICVTDSY